jgi:hypothetical protein
VEALGGFLGPFLERHDLRFIHAGAMTPGEFERATKTSPAPPYARRVSESPLVPITEHERQFEGMDVCLVPLADKPFNEAKSALKGMQAAAAGVPFVATAMPEYRWLQDTRGVGRTAKNPRQWVNHLEALMDPKVRAVDVLVNQGSIEGMGLPLLRAQWEVLLTALR